MELPKNQQVTNDPQDRARRETLAKLGKLAIYTPPTISLGAPPPPPPSD